MSISSHTMEDNFSCSESRNDNLFRKSTSGGNSVATEPCQVVAVSTDDFFDEAEVAQASEITTDAGGGQVWQIWFQVGATNTADIELRSLQGTQQGMLGLVKEVEAFDAMPINFFGCGELVEAAIAGGEIVESGKKFEIAAVAAVEYLAQIDQTVNRLLDCSQFSGGVPIAVFHLAVVLEEGNIVGRGLYTQHTTEFIVHLDGVLAQAMLDAGALDPGGKL